MNSLVFEASFVGVFLAVVMALVAWTIPKSVSTPLAAAVSGFAIGVATHLFFEFTGLNARYCRTGHACA